MPLLQPHEGPIPGRHYLASTVETVTWGWLPTEGATQIAEMGSGETITVDTVSHEGIVEDHGRDPRTFFGQFGVGPDDVLRDAVDIAAGFPVRDASADGPHVVTGPIAVSGARPGDVLKIDFLELVPRAPYGVISSRHGYGALAGELPPLPYAGFEPDPSDPEKAGHVSKFCRASADFTGSLAVPGGRELRFPLAPFLGLIGVTPSGATALNSVPPGPFGGNMDVKDLVAGTSLYLPVQVDGAGLFMGDPHYAQGHGEVALTALEAPLRATLRATVLPAEESRALLGLLQRPFGETSEHWIALGLHRDLNEAFREAVREALRVLTDLYQVPTDDGYAYLSAAADFVVTQVVDDVKGVHCLIRKSDFAAWT
ncbi:acetamidase [Actinacidiphila oryziradicis]|jgi:acetamidase/formamidase|uniref:Acetamidase n=2 Tax=Actinacidiphila oryziradicis TaxID=2571141 RepID=A0A4U0SAG0_9ACTN|nr:acetamidase [Actinacidiphila oryziradicis]